MTAAPLANRRIDSKTSQHQHQQVTNRASVYQVTDKSAGGVTGGSALFPESG